MKRIHRTLASVPALLSAAAVKVFAAPAGANPLTGDDFNMQLCITVMAICVVGIAAILVVLLITQSKLLKQRKQQAQEATEEIEETVETDAPEVTEQSDSE